MKVCRTCEAPMRADDDRTFCEACVPPISFCRVFQVGPICPGVCAGCLPAAAAMGYNARAQRVSK